MLDYNTDPDDQTDDTTDTNDDEPVDLSWLYNHDSSWNWQDD